METERIGMAKIRQTFCQQEKRLKLILTYPSLKEGLWQLCIFSRGYVAVPTVSSIAKFHWETHPGGKMKHVVYYKARTKGLTTLCPGR